MGILGLETHEQGECLQGEIPTIHEVAQENEVLVAIRQVLPRCGTLAPTWTRTPDAHTAILTFLALVFIIVVL